MKTEWQFFYESKDLIFEKEHKFKRSAKGSIPDALDLSIPEDLSIDVCITPDKEKKNKLVDQTGSLYITLPLPFEKAKNIAYNLAYFIAQKISFESGEFRLLSGLITGKHIPETPEEEIEIGEKPYFAEVRFIEAVDPPKFDARKFSEKSNENLDMRLVAQHNEAKKANNPIDKFLGFFKILESQFSLKTKKRPIRDCLKNDKFLFNIYKSTFKFDKNEQAQESFEGFIAAIVHARHRCAHLKANKDFGYVPLDPKLKNEVEPYLFLLEILTYETIIKLSESV